MPNTEAKEGAKIIYNEFFSLTNPIYIYIESDSPVFINDTINSNVVYYVKNITYNLDKIEEVISIFTINRPFGEEIDVNYIMNNSTLKNIYFPFIERFVGKSNKAFIIMVIINKQPFSLEAVSVLNKIKEVIPVNEHFKVYYGGVTQLVKDSKETTDNAFFIILVSLVSIIILILFIQLNSIIIPLRLVFTISCSIIWSLSMVYIVYQLYYKLPIINAAPIFLIVTMLGVGVDYDIFIVTRIKEEVYKGKNDEEAISIALEKVGFTIIVLGLILAGVFFFLLIPDFPLINQVGFTIGLAVLFDSLIIILFYVPSLMLLAKKWNWWPSKIKNAS